MGLRLAVEATSEEGDTSPVGQPHQPFRTSCRKSYQPSTPFWGQSIKAAPNLPTIMSQRQYFKGDKCRICKVRNVTLRAKGHYRSTCYHCNGAGFHGKPWVQFKKSQCEFCGFIPVHPCQLDVDHKDADKKNNHPSNLQTLCANCHRLKTQVNQDFRNCTNSAYLS